MNIADRIQNLRKVKGISQEELADKVGVSRQAVSKWEGEQSVPDLEKVIIMSEYFNVTTDYILKGIEPTEDCKDKSHAIASKILYVASTAFIVIGLLCAFGSWYEEQTAEVIWGSMIVQAIGVAGYFIGDVRKFCVKVNKGLPFRQEFR
jgi:transcriptional regulator with XRE-family HTH domain